MGYFKCNRCSGEIIRHYPTGKIVCSSCGDFPDHLTCPKCGHDIKDDGYPTILCGNCNARLSL